ncbi:uncharacterized protein LOC127590845 isoform X5 [Hippocampus zosterae]|uniref:uncharacterized protein LOC127590845 isoform X5 n=1 Tax=Hippocampus zosterae TaxID=109293 RepID=UPI00223CC4FC|nr:uncharacterized protein LOC127590845 isoform X5 [Hippocampus zosterae]
MLQTPNDGILTEPSGDQEGSERATSSLQQTPSVPILKKPSEDQERSGRSTSSLQQTPSVPILKKPSEDQERSGRSTSSLQQTPSDGILTEPSGDQEGSERSTSSLQQVTTSYHDILGLSFQLSLTNTGEVINQKHGLSMISVVMSSYFFRPEKPECVSGDMTFVLT